MDPSVPPKHPVVRYVAAYHNTTIRILISLIQSFIPRFLVHPTFCFYRYLRSLTKCVARTHIFCFNDIIRCTIYWCLRRSQWYSMHIPQIDSILLQKCFFNNYTNEKQDYRQPLLAALERDKLFQLCVCTHTHIFIINVEHYLSGTCAEYVISIIRYLCLTTNFLC